MLHKALALSLGFVLSLVIVVHVFAADSLGWRLPFNGIATITNGPGEGAHKLIYISGIPKDSREAIDYAMNGQSFPVIAPADGAVVDYLTQGTDGFGRLLRIYHPNSSSCSFFAHLDSATKTTHNQAVLQGDIVGYSGMTGLTEGSGIHLHFEALGGCNAGQPYSGSAVPIRGLFGNWWANTYEFPLTPAPVPAAHASLLPDGDTAGKLDGTAARDRPA